MEQILLKIVQMSTQASIVIGAIMLARICLRKIPKKYTYMLWFVVGFRLLCPLDFHSGFSVFNLKPVQTVVETTSNKNETFMRNTELAYRLMKQNVSKDCETAFQINAMESGLSLKQLLLVLWFVGVALILCITIIKYAKLLRHLRGAKQIEERIYESKVITAPFVLGICRPRIYLPVDIDEQERKYLILHEQIHIQYGDYFIKCIGFLAATIHWFNPLVWLAYFLYSKDVEMRCDEVVIDKLGYRIKKDYSLSLVSYATKKENMMYIVMPLGFSNKGFGGMEVKMRINNILGYKKVSKIVAVLAIAAVGGVSVFCASNAKETQQNEVAVKTEKDNGVVVGKDQAATEEIVATANESATDVTVENGEGHRSPTTDAEGNELGNRYIAKIEYYKVINEEKGEYESVDASEVPLQTRLDLRASLSPEIDKRECTEEEQKTLDRYITEAKEKGLFVEKIDAMFYITDERICDNCKTELVQLNLPCAFVTDTESGENTIGDLIVVMNEEEFKTYLKDLESIKFEKVANGYHASGVDETGVVYDIEYNLQDHILYEHRDFSNSSVVG